MKVVIAPDSFKDAMRASEAAKRIAQGLRAVAVDAEIDACPIADGGEGFLDAIANAQPIASRRETPTFDPLMRSISGAWVTIDDPRDGRRSAVLDLASASGLERLESHERNPCATTTFGTGVLIEQALLEGADRVVLGIGGSATNDAGLGIAEALGATFFDDRGRPIDDVVTGGELMRVHRIEPPPSSTLDAMRLAIACDVTNPLTGPNGAAHVYAPQKGATPEQVEELDAGLRHMAQLWRNQLGVDVEHLPGAGAAGGVGGGLVAMLGAELVPGAELVLDTIGFDERIKDADLVITGEGRLDGQSLQGKAAMTVARRCRAAGVPCVALVGSVGRVAEQALTDGLIEYRVIGEGLTADESIRRTGELLEQAAMKLAQERLIG
jgi:glycerate kinase